MSPQFLSNVTSNRVLKIFINKCEFKLIFYRPAGRGFRVGRFVGFFVGFLTGFLVGLLTGFLNGRVGRGFLVGLLYFLVVVVLVVVVVFSSQTYPLPTNPSLHSHFIPVRFGLQLALA